MCLANARLSVSTTSPHHDTTRHATRHATLRHDTTRHDTTRRCNRLSVTFPLVAARKGGGICSLLDSATEDSLVRICSTTATGLWPLLESNVQTASPSCSFVLDRRFVSSSPLRSVFLGVLIQHVHMHPQYSSAYSSTVVHESMSPCPCLRARN